MRAGLLLALAAIVSACGAGPDDASEPEAASETAGAAPSFREIGPDAEPLRSAFEADRGKVRAIFLVSPT